MTRLTHKYGYFRPDGRDGAQVLAHRFAWQLDRGEIPAGQNVIQVCGDRLCVLHLTLGTQRETLLLMRARGRANDPRGEDHPKHKLTESQALEVAHSSEPSRAAARRLGVSDTSIRHIRNGRNWGWLTGIGREAA